MKHRELLAFIDRLREARTFEVAAQVTLRAMLDAAHAALEESQFAKQGRILRGMAHLRPADGYQRLVVLEHARQASASAGAGAGAGEKPAHLPSATAWRWVAKHQCAVSVDVMLGRVQLHRGPGAEEVTEMAASSVGPASHESLTRLMMREASHLYVVPLGARRGERGVVEGMISVEAECPAAAGHDFVLAGAGEVLQLLADIAGPYLSTLPLGQSSPVATDEHLPVLGPTMAGLVQLLRVFAQQDETILLGGPTGAGKSRLARWCHERSPRRGHPFEALDLLTVPEDLQMAELFGWRKGAFTGAVRDNPGSVSRAEGGTLFIDEIDKLSMKAQAGLLHLLEERTYRPLGEAARERRANVRFVIGTNVDLHGLVQAGRFREDLYYRINVLPVRVPALADRREEIAPWARYMAIRRHREAVPGGEARLSAAAEQMLTAQQWPGNLRQLDNVVRRAYTLALMGMGMGMGAGGQSPGVVLDEQHVAQALGLERSAPRRSVLEGMRAAAAVFVEEAERSGLRGATLDLDLCDAFRGLALGTAVQRLGSREAAFRLFGKGAQVQGRNHHKALRRELEKVEALCRALGVEGGSPFASLIDGEDPGAPREG